MLVRKENRVFRQIGRVVQESDYYPDVNDPKHDPYNYDKGELNKFLKELDDLLDRYELNLLPWDRKILVRTKGAIEAIASI